MLTVYRKKNLLLALFVAYGCTATAQSKEALPLYKNPKYTSAQRANDLLKRMTDEEKVAQLMAAWNSNFSYTANALDSTAMKQMFGMGVHSLQPSFTGIEETVNIRNTVQKFLMEKTRLGIPALFVDEGQHGLMKPESTVFPQAIGLACSWNPSLIEKVYDVTAKEMRSRGTHHVLSPVIDVCRESRWGRVEETYGEDPFLNGVIGVAAVKGFQGSSTGIIDSLHVGATLKHLVGHGQPEGGINQAPANYSLRTLYEAHFPPFERVIAEAKPASVMPSYNEVDGVPSHANKWLLKDVLRKQFGFKGMIVSDYNGIRQLLTKDSVASDDADAATIAFNAGVQSEFPTPKYYKLLPALLKQNKISRKEFDSAVLQVLKYKFDFGLFENPYINLQKALEQSKLPSSKQLALEAARQSIVLLKNDGVLPLTKTKYKKIAVVGPGANVALFGGYAGEPYEKITLMQGIKNKLGDSAEVLYAEGCRLTDNPQTTAQGNWKVNEIKITPRSTNIKLIQEAKSIAKDADIIILALGENEQLCREAWSKGHIGDNMSLDLFGDQQELADSLATLGKPIILYLQNGRPLSINKLNKTANAIIEGWYMGQEAGTAAADILFGDMNPSGKLTITFPKSVGQLPMFYNHKPAAQFHNYISQDIQPLYPFGYGLSYTKFNYSPISLSNKDMNTKDTIWASVKVTNAGKMKGDEIVQLYIRDEFSSVTRPVKELKGFQRISLEAGETKTVTFPIEKSLLAFWDINMNYVVEPGTFKIMIGTSSQAFIESTIRVK
jgi:beta-glucosidase